MIIIFILWFILYVDNVKMKIVLDDIRIDVYFFNIYIFFYDYKKCFCYVLCFIFNFNMKRINYIFFLKKLLFVYNFYLLL